MENTSVMSWNVRGLNDRSRRDTVRTLVDDVRPSIVCLQETKLAVIPQHMVFAMLGLSYSVFAYLPASNTRGGILIAAREADISMSDVLVGCFSVTVKVRHASQAEADDDRSWWLSSVYGPQDDSDKALFLEEIEAIRDACSGPWVLAGDFNLILSEADKNNDLITELTCPDSGERWRI